MSAYILRYMEPVVQKSQFTKAFSVSESLRTSQSLLATRTMTEVRQEAADQDPHVRSYLAISQKGL